jgi:hypothetical protein
MKWFARFGSGSATAKENSLTKDFRLSFETLVKKYESPEDHDAATKALAKIDEVKNVMHDNIALSMQNTTTMESITNTTGPFLSSSTHLPFFKFYCCILFAVSLETQASVFKKSTVQMSKALWWQNFKVISDKFLLKFDFSLLQLI